MSVFKKRVDHFCEQFQLPLSTKISLYGHYPLFKAAWLDQHGQGFKAKVSHSLVNITKNYNLKVTLPTKTNKNFSLPINFSPANLDSFQEIFFGSEYQSPWSLEGCKTMIDLGANIGMATQYFLTQAPLEKVVMVEANPQLAKNLRVQFANLKLGCKFLIKEICVSGTSGESVRFSIKANNRDSGISVSSGSKEEDLSFKTTSLNQLIDQCGFDQVDILKMDIEGAEHDIIAHDFNSLKRFRYLFCEVHGEKLKRENFKKQLEELGFTVKTLSSQDPYHCSILSAKNKAF